MTNPSDLLSLRQAIARSEFAQQSQKVPSEASEVYTFAGYASGLDCKVKKANGEVLSAHLETNGLIKEGQIVCCYQSGGQLLVRGMNKPYPENPNVPEAKEKSRIKILYVKKTTTNVELYIGGDRQKPKMIARFPLGTVIKGLCHNLGTGDKYSIGVTTELKIDATTTDRYVKTWTAGSGRSETTTVKTDWKNDRIQPIGYGFFAEGWMPKLLEKKWLFTTLNADKTEKSLNFFDNKEVYKLRAMPTAAVIEAYVIRKALDDYSIIITAIAVGGTRQVSILTKTAVEALPKVKPEKWVFEAIDYLIDQNGSTFFDKNLTGSAQVLPSSISKKLALKIWQAAIGTFKLSSTATLEESTIIRSSGKNDEKKVAIGSISSNFSVLPIKLTRAAAVSYGFPNGDVPPNPGVNPLYPYSGWVYSFASGVITSVRPGDNFEFALGWNPWIVAPNFQGAILDGINYPTSPPKWTLQGVCLGIQYRYVWDLSSLALGPPSTLAELNGLTPRNRRVTEIPQNALYPADPNAVLAGRPDLYDGFSPIPVGWIVGPIRPEARQCIIAIAENGQTSEIWDEPSINFYDGNVYNNKNKDIVNWPPGTPRFPAPSVTPKGPDLNEPTKPSEAPWTLEDYLWNDPIVVGKSGEALWKNKVFIDYTGNPPKKPAAKKDDKLLKFKAPKPPNPIGGGLSEDILEVTIAGKFPLLCAEDNLVGSKLFRVDRSVFYPAIPGTPNPRRSSIKRLLVETYTLSATTAVTVKKYPIFPIPDDVEILSASFHL